jgi:hypothetical protein
MARTEKDRSRTKALGRRRAQLLAPFMLVDFGLAAFFD